MKNLNNLPELCFYKDEVNGGDKLIIIKRGQSGYYPSEYTGDFMERNEEIGVTREQAEAMKAGSMFGWDTPGANPDFYKGKFNK